MKGLFKTLIIGKMKLWLIGLIFSTGGLIIAGVTVVAVILVLILGGEKENSNSVDGGCSIGMEGGDISKEGMKIFAMNAKGGAFDGKTDLFVKVAKKHKIAPSLLAAIVASESGWGKAQNATVSHNPMSLMGSGALWQFDTIEEGLDRGAKNLFDLYIKEGLTTPEKIGPKYAPVGASNDPTNLNSNWVKTVKQIMGDLQSDKPILSGEVSDCFDDTPNSGKSLKSLEKYNGKLPKSKHPHYNPNYPVGQCTWWAYTRRKELGLPAELNWGNARTWAVYAEEQGYTVRKKPVQGAIGVNTTMGDGYGHVVFVEKVLDGGKKFHSSEHNWNWDEAYHEQDITVTSDWTFIYDKKK